MTEPTSPEPRAVILTLEPMPDDPSMAKLTFGIEPIGMLEVELDLAWAIADMAGLERKLRFFPPRLLHKALDEKMLPEAEALLDKLSDTPDEDEVSLVVKSALAIGVIGKLLSLQDAADPQQPQPTRH